MTPAGYMLKKVVVRPDWLKSAGVDDIYSVSGCISALSADYDINFWQHNGYWFFNSPSDVIELCRRHDIDTFGDTLFYYEMHERQFDEETAEWLAVEPDRAFATQVKPPSGASLEGYDVTTFSSGRGPECSPLSCNSVAQELTVNRHCLFDRFEEAIEALESGKFDGCEPGPFRIFAVYTIETWRVEA